MASVTRRKKRVSPPGLYLEHVLWSDNASTEGDGRALLDTSVFELETIGWLVDEDEKQIVLAAEVESNEDFMNQPMKYTQILKINVIKRNRLLDSKLFWGIQDKGNAQTP